ncbi:helix-turn-helix domain-containing protein [Chloroflexales bacterium ZM16-3]|nr:helix-turn-helix domain-containing protein [Chloroflexales bacterium ZM16-3]
MSTSPADLLLHPIRLRIIVALTVQQLTVQQLAGVLPDVPQATLYRQIHKLV